MISEQRLRDIINREPSDCNSIEPIAMASELLSLRSALKDCRKEVVEECIRKIETLRDGRDPKSFSYDALDIAVTQLRSLLPVEEEVSDPEFDAVWKIIKEWDIGKKGTYAGVTEDDVRAILNPLKLLRASSQKGISRDEV